MCEFQIGAILCPLRFEKCQATEGDARLVMAWRNDPVTLAMSYHRAAKSWDDFWPEFRDSYCGGQPAPLFAVVEGVRAGFLRFRPAPHPGGGAGRCTDISINLAPEVRGRGWGTAILKAAAGYLRAEGVKTVLAEVRRENTASARAFEAAGYRPLGPGETEVADTKERVLILSFILEL